MSTESSAAAPGRPMITGRLTILFAVAAGVAVSDLYWAQPLLDFIARDLHASTSDAGWLITATQVGYAVGVLMIVPLGDVLDRRRLIPAMMLCAAVALTACALAPTFAVLMVAIVAVGCTTVGGQLLAPLAGDMAEEAERGRVVGKVVSGILTGILVSRTISGLIADAAGWRTVYFMAAAANILFAVLLYRSIPRLQPKIKMPYPALIASVGAVVKRERTVRWTLALGATGFSTFTLFWTSLTFLLSGPPFNYSVSVIGLFGLAGVAGALTAQRVGQLHDRGLAGPAQGAACVLLICSFVVAAFAGHSVLLVLVAIVMLDIALQGLNILNQTRLFAVSTKLAVV